MQVYLQCEIATLHFRSARNDLFVFANVLVATKAQPMRPRKIDVEVKGLALVDV